MSRTLLRSIPQVLAIALVAWVTFLVVRSGLLPDAPAGASTWLPTAALIAAGALALGAHELGHVAAGLAAGFGFGALYLGPLRLTGGTEGLRVRANRRLALWGGAAQMVPRASGHTRARHAVLVAGGPAASLLLGAVALWVYGTLLGPLVALGTLDPAADALARALVGFGLTSLGVGLVTLVPGTTSGFPTDGAQLLAILRGRDNPDWSQAMAAVRALAARGEGPEALSDELLADVLAASESVEERAHAWLLAYVRGLALGNDAVAAENLEAALEVAPRLPARLAAIVRVEAAYFAAAHRGDAAVARDLLAAAGPHARSVGEPRFRAEAAILLAEGDAAGAAPHLRKARAEALDLPDPGHACFVGGLLDRLTERAGPAIG